MLALLHRSDHGSRFSRARSRISAVLGHASLLNNFFVCCSSSLATPLSSHRLFMDTPLRLRKHLALYTRLWAIIYCTLPLHVCVYSRSSILCSPISSTFLLLSSPLQTVLTAFYLTVSPSSPPSVAKAEMRSRWTHSAVSMLRPRLLSARHFGSEARDGGSGVKEGVLEGRPREAQERVLRELSSARRKMTLPMTAMNSIMEPLGFLEDRLGRSPKRCLKQRPNTKMLCTVGPSLETTEDLERAVDAGMRIMRINCSHAQPSEVGQKIDRLRSLRGPFEYRGQNVNLRAVLMDTQGPEIRTGRFPEGVDEVELVEGRMLTLTADLSEADTGTAERVFVNYPGIDACKPGQQILLDDGLIALRAVRRKGDGELVVCVLDGGFLGARKGVNIPGVHLDLPPLSDKDKELLRVGLAKDIDYVAASFVSRGSDVRIIRSFLRDEMQKLGLDPNTVLVPRIISKIENAEALDNFAEILEESDAIMIARGDLGVEIPFRKVTTAQKLMVQQCNQAGKPVIVATQMLESMIKNARPTRAEVSDVYNAVVDGADAVMLSGESAKGKYPIQSISTMQMILREAEKAGESLDHNRTRYVHKAPTERRLHALAEAAVLAADKINAKLIIVLSHRGQTARVVAKYRPRQAIMAMCTNPKAARQLNLELGVRAVLSSEETPAEGVRIARELGLAEAGDNVVMLLSEKDKDGTAPGTHSIRIMVVPRE